MKPLDIERRSFEIIAEELGGRTLEPEYDLMIRRVIHATADFEFADTFVHSPHAAERLQDALRRGCGIVTDTTMAQAGINKRALSRFGGRVHCFIADEDVAGEARARGVTRSLVSMEKAARLGGLLVFAIGNAPTALFSICELIRRGALRPEMVIGVPVGFVNVVEAKEELMRTAEHYIVVRGRKGGSSVAAAIVNAALYQLTSREE